MDDKDIGVQLYTVLTNIINHGGQDHLSIDILASKIDKKLTDSVSHAVNIVKRRTISSNPLSQLMLIFRTTEE